jgi:GT2 family glycosyltransferase
VNQPELSVVIATRNRARRLEALLRSLARQEGAELEAVVVDDGSSDGTPEVVAAGVEGLAIRSLRNDSSRGPAAARNGGWQAANAPLAVFVDDDVVAEPGFASALVDAHRRQPRAVLQGHTRFDPRELERATVFWRSIKVEGIDPFFPTCNIAYPRELLERLGGFDERFLRPAGEDTDLGWRARELGAEVVYVPEALVSHAVHQMGLLRMLKDARRIADNPAVARRHPGVREGYHHHFFWHASHERVLGLVAGAALARRTRGASLALAIPYALTYRRHHGGWPGTLLSLPGYAAIDLAQMAFLLRGSVRHRSLVL